MKVNIYFFIVFILSCIAFVGDIIIYIFNLKYLLALILSTIFVGLIFLIFLKCKKIFITVDFEKSDILLFIAMFFITIISGIVYPDYVYDTISYHEYLQKNPFIDKVNFDFFPGRIYCMFLFPLGDRMFYIIRYFFGYRFGAILSFFSAIVIFYQVKKILKLLTDNSKISSIISYGIFGIIAYSINIGTYYIDPICVLFTNQILLLILENDDIFEKKFKLYIIALLSGISIGIKITQVFFIVPLIIYMIYTNRKSIKKLKILDIILCIILAILPYIVYLIDSYVQTGSILFPYYNNILKSEYFEKTSWTDERFNLSGIFNYLFWPVIKGFSYGCYGDDNPFIDPIFGVAYLFTIAYFIYGILSKKRDKIFELSIVAIANYIFWIAVMKGYFRYGSFVGILFCIEMLAIIANLIDQKININKLTDLFFILLISEILIGAQMMYLYCDYENGKQIFKDTDKEEYKISIDGVWGAPEDCVGFVSLVRKENTPIYNLHKDYFDDTDKTLNMWEEKIKNNDIYTIIDYYGGEFEDNNRVKALTKDGFEIEEVVEVYTSDEIPYINTNSLWYLVKINYIE